MENNSSTADNTSIGESSSSGHRRRDSLASRIQNAVKLPSLNTSNILSSSSSSNPTTPLDQEMFNLQISLNPEDYNMLDPIGYGSSAVVYAAIYKPLQKKVAIKLIDLDMFERNQIEELRRELQIMSLCKHKNVLPVYGAFVHKAKLYIVTPFLAGGSCLHIMKTAFQDGLDEVTIATILKECLQGLDYLHKQGHIHRDIKAGNILVDDNGSVYVADFGVSSSLMEHGERKSQRRTFVGTPCWMAPEVLTPEKGYNCKADIWSFGITALELATGQAPYARFPPLKVLMLTLHHEPPSLEKVTDKSKFSRSFANFIDICLQKDPEKRPSAEELLKHSFLKQAKKKEYLIKNILADLPPLKAAGNSMANRPKSGTFERGVSWDFDDVSSPESTDFLELSPETTNMYSTMGYMKKDLPVVMEEDESAEDIQESEVDQESKENSPTDGTVRRGRFSVNVYPKESERIESPNSLERRGRFAVTSVESNHKRVSSSSSTATDVSMLLIAPSQAKSVVEKSIMLRKAVASGQASKQLLDEIITCMIQMEAIINSNVCNTSTTNSIQHNVDQ